MKLCHSVVLHIEQWNLLRLSKRMLLLSCRAVKTLWDWLQRDRVLHFPSLTYQVFEFGKLLILSEFQCSYFFFFSGGNNMYLQGLLWRLNDNIYKALVQGGHSKVLFLYSIEKERKLQWKQTLCVQHILYFLRN